MPLDLETIKSQLRQERFLRQRRKRLGRFLVAVAFFVGLETVLFLYVIGGAVVAKSSMYPEVQDGDFVVYSRMAHTLDAGEIAVIHGGAEDVYYIKRVIALAGDTVDLTEGGGVTVNGMLLDEPYVQHAPTTRQDIAFPQTVPPGHIFVLGDNRTVSLDSRSSEIGMVPLPRVNGTLLFSVRLR